MFSISAQKGFHITFANGWTVSVQFGSGNYCDNRNISAKYGDPVEPCRNAEIAAWDADGNWHNFGRDEVDGYNDPAAVLEFMNMIAAK